MELHSVLLLVVLPCFLLSVRCADLEDASDILKVPNTLEVEDKIGQESTSEPSQLHEDEAVVQAPDESTAAVKSKCPNRAEVDSSAKDDSCRKQDSQPDENADVKQNKEGQPLVAEDLGSEEAEADSQSDSNTDKEAVSVTAKRVQSTKLVLEAFGTPSTDVEAEEEGTTESPEEEEDQSEEELWTEQTGEGSEQKRAGGRRFFSLMNLIKFLLNPVIEEFRVEKSAPSSDAPAPAAATAAATTASASSNGNGSDLADTPAANSSEVSESEENKKNGTDSGGKKTKFQCVGRNVTENSTAAVRVVNSTVLLEILSFDKNHTSSDCVLVMFYAPWCCFCAATAPNYNAVARAFPQLEVLAVDTVHFSNLNARFGTVAVPNIMLFHQSRSAVRFNHTNRNFQTLLQFITNTTGLDANSSVEVTGDDLEGPLSSVPTEETDYLLWFAWLFIVVCSGYIFISSQAGQRAIERVNVLWQEHQHQHIE